MTTAPLRIAIVGAGLIGQRHIAQVEASADARVAGVIDPAIGAGMYAGPVYRCLTDIAPHEADAAIIATPNSSHAELALACSERGWPVLMEKPITDTVESALRVTRAFETAGLPLLVGHHRRHHAFVRQTRQILAAGDIGTPVLVSAIWAVRKPDDYFDAGRWRLGSDGGPVMINIIHEVDMIRHLFGEITDVLALGSNAMRGSPVEDSAVVALRFESGLLASIAITDAAHSPWSFEAASGENPGIAESGAHAWRITGTRGALEFPTLRLWRATGSEDWSAALRPEDIPVSRTDPLAAQLAHFIRLVRREETVPLIGGGDATETLRITRMIAEACRMELMTEGNKHHATS